MEQLDYQGWVLRFAKGATKRANSANVLVPHDDSLDEMILYCESWFAARSQPTIFRLPSFVDPAKLDLRLADADYRFVDPSLVLYQTIQTDWEDAEHPEPLDRAAWLEVYCNLSAVELASQTVHTEILARIPSSSLFAVLRQHDQPVACGLGVIHQGCFGIFDLITKQQVRNKGYGNRLVKQMIAWARSHEIHHFYLQVTAHNAPAIRLYEKLGYRYLYHYWYRVQRNDRRSHKGSD